MSTQMPSTASHQTQNTSQCLKCNEFLQTLWVISSSYWFSQFQIHLDYSHSSMCILHLPSIPEKRVWTHPFAGLFPKIHSARTGQVKARRFIQVSHMGGRNWIIWTLTCHTPRKVLKRIRIRGGVAADSKLGTLMIPDKIYHADKWWHCASTCTLLTSNFFGKVRFQ